MPISTTYVLDTNIVLVSCVTTQALSGSLTLRSTMGRTSVDSIACASSPCLRIESNWGGRCEGIRTMTTTIC